MGARVTVRVVPNMEALPCLQIINEQTGSEPSTALFSPARSSSTSWVPTYYTPLVKPIHGLISAFFPVGRQFGTSRPNTLVCGHGYQSGSFLMGIVLEAPISNSTPAGLAILFAFVPSILGNISPKVAKKLDYGSKKGSPDVPRRHNYNQP